METKKANSQIFFPGLTPLRGLAASVVVLCHVDQFHHEFNYSSIGLIHTNLGSDAVTLFFVLSGFLITFFLLKEKELTGKINLKNFYIRRILRIWPVYYMALLISLVLVYFEIVPSPKNIGLVFLLYIFLAANVVYVLGLAIRSLTPLWSVGVEEQFYAVWPLIINRSRSIPKSLIGIIVLYILLKILFWHLNKNGGEYTLVELTRIDCMAMGGLLSYCFYKDVQKKILYTTWIQVFSILFIVVFSFLNVKLIYALDIELKAFFFGIIILNTATNKQTIFRLENKILNFLGIISYGLYSYHMIVIFILSYFLSKNHFPFVSSNYFLCCVLIFGLSISFALLSYKFLEQPILKLKIRFTSLKEI